MKKGFTLVETLVAVFIIGLISTIILVNLGHAHDKAKDNNVKNALLGVKTASGIYFMEKANYSYFCSSPNTIALMNEMNAQGGSASCQNAADKWAIATILPSAGNKPYPWTCIDSTGNSIEYTDKVGSIINNSCAY